MSEQPDLPNIESGALVLGPVFFYMELPGDPWHWERPRARMVFPKLKKAFIHFFTSKEMEGYELAMKQLATIVMRRRHNRPTEEPLSLTMTAFLRIPKSWSQRDRQSALAGRILPTSRPDADNYLKLIDALNGIVWKDDAQVVTAKTVKRYSDQPGLCIEVCEYVPP